LIIDKHQPQLPFEVPHASAEELRFGSRHTRRSSARNKTQQEKLTIPIDGLFTEIAKKAFMCLCVTTTLRCPKPESASCAAEGVARLNAADFLMGARAARKEGLTLPVKEAFTEAAAAAFGCWPMMGRARPKMGLAG
jgi:hypothetical protein